MIKMSFFIAKGRTTSAGGGSALVGLPETELVLPRDWPGIDRRE